MMRGSGVQMLCVAQLLLQARALPNVSAVDTLDIQPGEPNGAFWIVSTAESRWPNKDFGVNFKDGNSAVIQAWDHRESNATKYWLYIDKEASASDRTSALIVSTCASRYPGEGLFLSDTGLSTWKHEPARPDRKMLWDLIPVDNGMRFYIVSNADSRYPSEMLFLNDAGVLDNWRFQEDRRAQWFLKRAPVPKSCDDEEPPAWQSVLYSIGGFVFICGGAVCLKLVGVGLKLTCEPKSDPPNATPTANPALSPASVNVAPFRGEGSGNNPTTALYHANSFQLPSSSVQPPLRGEASGNFPTTTFQYAYPVSFQRGSA